MVRASSRSLPVTLAAFAALALAALLVLAAAPAVAEAGACNRYGDVEPQKLNESQARRAVVCLVNRKRHSHGVGELDRSGKLMRAAQRHSERMRSASCFSHQCPGEGSLETRLRSVGYLGGGLSRWVYGENVAWGMRERGTPEAIVEAWMNSPPHRATMLNPSFRDLGAGFASGSPSSRSHAGGLYTIDLGLRVG